MSGAPTRGMVLAAGLGERMRPITDSLPKPLIPIAGKPLLDHALDRLAAAGVTDAVVNVYHLGEQIVAHVAGRTAPTVKISEEAKRLETGGGVAHALPLLGADPFYAVNGDALWLDGSLAALDRLAGQWDDDRMDALLLVYPTVRADGYDGPGDFVLDPCGLTRRREEGEIAPFVFTGVQILHPRLFADAPAGPFSLNRVYDRAIEAERLWSVVHDGIWLHIGTPDAIAPAETVMRRGGPFGYVW
jgi:MurNAc alpha-1-phosphate uridylyltransferase